MSAGNRTTPGFTAELSLAAAAGMSHRGTGRLPDEPPAREAVTPAAPIRHDGGPKPPGNCMLMCDTVREVPDLRVRDIRRGSPFHQFGRRVEASGCSWICVPDPF